MSELSERVEGVLAGTCWSAGAAALAEQLGGRDDVAEAIVALSPAPFTGLVRACASNLDAARFLSHRRSLAERLREVGAEWPTQRVAELDSDSAPSGAGADLEGFLDDLRLLRRDETLLAAMLDFGGTVPFAAISVLLSAVAEAITRRALIAACESLESNPPPLTVVALGKLGGREFTYESDLDIIFLHDGPTAGLATSSRVAQRLISYVSTLTGAGLGYRVDARLRPSGRQGTLVTSLPAFERYQREEAAVWEHLALVRARAIAGPIETAERALETLRGQVLGRPEWTAIADMRRRVEAERGRDDGQHIPLKTGAGGLMDAEFLAQGAALELGLDRAQTPLPTVPLLLRAVGGEAAEKPIEAYLRLRKVESRARWIFRRPIEQLDRQDARFPEIAELCEPGWTPEMLEHQVADARTTLRTAFTAVIDAGTARALGR
jgi:glutamate-ammonia-ligase adenylyltransferase